MNKEALNKALEVEQLEDRFEMTIAALDGDRCTANGNDVDTGGGNSGGGGTPPPTGGTGGGIGGINPLETGFDDNP